MIALDLRRCKPILCWSHYYSIVLVYGLLNSVTSSNVDESFRTFVTRAMKEYPSWAREQGLEPSVNEIKANLRDSHGVFRMNGTMRILEIMNYSGSMTCNVSSEMLNEGGFTIICNSTNVTINGDYQLSGRVFHALPIKGSGKFRISNGEISTQTSFYRFNVTTDGYIDMRNVSLDVIYYPFTQWDPSFEGLIASGYENKVLQIMKQAIEERMKVGGHPLADNIKRYLAKVFAESTVLEIITTAPDLPTAGHGPSSTYFDLSAGGSTPVVVSKEDLGFRNFLTKAMQSYPAWAIANGLEPSLNTTKINLYHGHHSLFRIGGDMMLTKVVRHSSPMEIKIVSDIMNSGSFAIGCSFINVTATGNYEFSGKIFNLLPTAGSGKVTLVIPRMYIEVNFSYFYITNDGYIDLSNAHVYARFHTFQGEIKFDNLYASGYEDLVLEILKRRVREDDVWKQMYFRKYLMEVFANTTIMNMVATTMSTTSTQMRDINLVGPSSSGRTGGKHISDEEGFRNFLTLAMQEYPAWSIGKGFESTVVDDRKISLDEYHHSMFPTRGEIRIHSVNYNSNSMMTKISSDLMLHGSFAVTSYLTNVQILGDYQISGKIFNMFPIEGSGNFSISLGNVSTFIYFYNFEITNDGYFDLRSYSVGSTRTDGLWDPVFFGLKASGFEDNVLKIMKKKFMEKLDWFPQFRYLRMYLRETLGNAKIMEVIKTALPLTTTTKLESTFTQNPSTGVSQASTAFPGPPLRSTEPSTSPTTPPGAPNTMESSTPSSSCTQTLDAFPACVMMLLLLGMF